MPFYSEKIDLLARTPASSGTIDAADAVGISASFSCGSFVRYLLSVDRVNLLISDIRFLSDGCGYAVASAEWLAQSIKGRSLAALHGMDPDETLRALESELEGFPTVRKQCAEMAIAALRAALANFRDERAREFNGDTALICSCFGVGEDAIEQAIETCGLVSVEQVSAATNAGSGCGSCRMLIQEMLDIRLRER